MANSIPGGASGQRMVQIVHLLLAAVAAVAITIGTQGWPSTEPYCEDLGTCPAANDARAMGQGPSEGMVLVHEPDPGALVLALRAGA